ncbi:MAG: hypothetical protein EHM46_05470 [Bacteroidetes bacterium]|nr:MAG: hypothetical protein EHM46_05470 [Bacteroidota bacterium]
MKPVFGDYSRRQRDSNTYDFQMGGKIGYFLDSCGLSIVYEENRNDPEIAFNGKAENRIIRSWDRRFERMFKFREFLGEEDFQSVKREFLDCLSNENHTSSTFVKYIVARKP